MKVTRKFVLENANRIQLPAGWFNTRPEKYGDNWTYNEKDEKGENDMKQYLKECKPPYELYMDHLYPEEISNKERKGEKFYGDILLDGNWYSIVFDEYPF